MREVYSGLTGNTIASLTNNARFAKNPSSTNIVSDLFEAPSDVDENYGQRMHGFIVPPVTGRYQFFIASDDQGALYLSTDDNPSNSRRIAYVLNYTAPRTWDAEVNQKSGLIQLEAGRRYYISALMKEAGGGDNLSVRWLRPDGVDEAPIPATYLRPIGPMLSAPVFSEQPLNQTVVVGRPASFSVTPLNLDPLTYQWFRDGVAIDGAVNPVLQLTSTAMGDNAAQFTCAAMNALGTNVSTAAVLLVVPDTTPPALTGVEPLGSNALLVRFSESVEAASASTVANYTVSLGVSVTGVDLGSDGRSVLLRTTPMALGVEHELSVVNVRDVASPSNPVATGTRWRFTPREFGALDVGAVSNPAQLEWVAGGVNIIAGGIDIGGGAEQFQFPAQMRSGGFDVRVRLASLSPSDPYARAGLMVRAGTDPGAPYAAVLATPGAAGIQFQSRTTRGAASVPSGAFPVNFPETWLRLKRAGSVITGYASLDGEQWTLLGSVTMTVPDPAFLGVAVASLNPKQTTRVAVRDFSAVSGGSVGNFQPQGERLGPSSRRTSLTFTEISYNPGRREDARDLEFIEIYNAGIAYEELGGYRVSGAIDFVFPTDFKLPAGGYVVLAKTPGDVEAVHSISGVLGPYAGRLGRSSSVRLSNRQGAVLLETSYTNESPWPAGADGTGHTLVLARPSYGEGDARAWSISSIRGGSPGGFDAIRPSPLRQVVINELLAHTDDPQLDFVELYNPGPAGVDLSGAILTDDATTNRFRIPQGTTLASGKAVAFDQNQLGFSLNAAGETLYLISSNQTYVVDAVRFGPQENGVSFGRFGDGAPEFRRLDHPTPGQPNSGLKIHDVVINEIMHSPVSGDANDEYVELYNRGASAIDLSGWRFIQGIDFRFPKGAKLPADGYVVVGKNAGRLLSNYSNLTAANTFGDFSGKLASSDRLVLARPDDIVSTNALGVASTNVIFVTVDEVLYRSDGEWSRWSNEGGSSLELVDPNSDHMRPSNWADSDETGKSSWGSVEVTDVLDPNTSNTGYPPNSVQITLQGQGECLVDDVEIFKVDGTNLVVNGDFESTTTRWVFQGNHSASSIVDGQGVNGSRALLVKAPARGDTGSNRIRNNFTGLSSGNTATIRAKFKWLRGTRDLIVRLRGAWLAAPVQMPVPTNLGTPGARNSRAVDNAPPAVWRVAHTPIFPAAGQPAVVTARAYDPSGVAELRLFYHPTPSGAVSSVPMVDDGSGADAVAGDGTYTGTIPGQAASALYGFSIQARDNTGAALATVWPKFNPSGEGMIKWGETLPAGTLPNYYLWVKSPVGTQINSNPLDNTYKDFSFAYGGGRVIYGGSIKDKGSPFHGGVGDFFITLPSEEPFLGNSSLAVCSVGNQGGDPLAQREQAAYWIAEKMEAPYNYRRFVNLFFRGSRFRNIMEDAQEPNGELMDSWTPTANSGDLYKIEDWFEFADDGRTFGTVDATLQKFLTRSGAYKLDRYRWAWRKRAVQDSSHNYTNLFELITAANAPASRVVAEVDRLVDFEQWTRVFALQRIVGNWDSYGYSRGKNAYVYKPDNGRWKMFTWDIDFVLGLGGGPTDGLLGFGDPVIGNLMNYPVFLRLYLRAFQEAVDGALVSTNIDPVLDARYAALIANGIGGVANPGVLKTYVSQRRASIVSQLAGYNAAFAVISNSGRDFSTNRSLATMTGSAPLSVQSIEVNGVAYPINWTSVNTWTLSVPLAAKANRLSLQAFDRFGNPLPKAAASFTVNFTGVLEKPEDFVGINEIHYHPSTPKTGFVELYNRSTTSTFDLSNWRLEGAGFTFPEGVVFKPNSYLVVVQNRAAFEAAFGKNLNVVGEFSGQLQNGGETLRLVRPGATPAEDLTIDEVRYDNHLPWPVEADGQGPSLQRIDPRIKSWRVGNWSTVETNNAVLATPGSINWNWAQLAEFPSLWLNEVQPENLGGVKDSKGRAGPWIELFNSGSTSIDLTGLHLTHTWTNLTEWSFPQGASLAAGAFAIVWADGAVANQTANEWHANFTLQPGSGVVALTRAEGATARVLDYMNYDRVLPGRSVGRYPDGAAPEVRGFYLATPGQTNNPSLQPLQVVINEWMADNVQTLSDSADGDYEDWFELYNAADEPADLSGYYLANSTTNRTQFRIPSGTIIPPRGFALVWADQEPGSNSPGSDLHVNFKLSKSGETIALFTPTGLLLDTVTFGAQTADVSQGRWPDGSADAFQFLDAPTPRSANVFRSSNRAPVLQVPADQTIAEGSSLNLRIVATDSDLPAQRLAFSLLSGAPEGMTLDPVTGALTWTPAEAQGPKVFSISVRATDDGLPSRSTVGTFKITVTEVNRAPDSPPLGELTVEEGSLLTATVGASDPDLPPNLLSFRLGEGAPAGVAVDARTGVLTWRPTEAQGEGRYEIPVLVQDDGIPALTTTNRVRVHVVEVDNPPVFPDLPDQVIEEGLPFTMSVAARDPDSPPRALNYTLVGDVPAGMILDPATGLLRWTPSESQGPSVQRLRIRATEVGGTLSSEAALVLNVREVNEAPHVQVPANYEIGAGELLSLIVSASDPDLPTQSLQFSLEPGAPAGMTIDASTGRIQWDIDPDAPASTNQVRVRVEDNGSPVLSTATSFQVIVRERFPVVINEILHTPAAGGSQWVELFNSSKSRSIDLGGMTFSANAAKITMPSPTGLAPGEYAVVIQNRAAFVREFGLKPRVLGEFQGALNPESDLLRLTLGEGTSTRVLTSVAIRSNGVYPATPPGSSLQLIDALRDPRRPMNWSVANGLPAGFNRTVVAYTNVWRFEQSGLTLPGNWNQPEFNDAAWASGRGLFYVETADLVAPKTTALTLGKTNYAFRTHFDYPGSGAAAQLKLSFLIDDGAVVYLNGVELYRLGMPEGAVTASTFATRTVGDAAVEGPFTVPASALRRGDNVLAVEVHQANATSSDIVFGLNVEIEGGGVASITPGEVNSVAAKLPALPPVWLSELVSINRSGTTDLAGEHEPWVEIVNLGLAPVDLGGWSLSDSVSNLARWTFPSGFVIGPGRAQVIWLDSQATQSTASESHAAFRTAPGAGLLLLGAPAGAANGIADWLEYPALSPDASFGRADVSTAFPGTILSAPTPGSLNEGSAAPNLPPVVAPIAKQRIEVGQTAEIRIQAVDPDQPSATLHFALEPGFPDGAVISADGVVRWTASSAFAGRRVTFLVRVQDGGAPPASATVSFDVEVAPVAVTSIRLAAVERVDATHIRLAWSTQPGHTYVVVSKQQLIGSTWQQEARVAASGVSASADLEIANTGAKFYRIEEAP